MIPTGTIHLTSHTAPRKKRRPVRVPLLCRIHLDRDLQTLQTAYVVRSRNPSRSPYPGIVKTWKRDLALAQEDQLGSEWVSKVSVDKPHPPRRIEIIRRCRKKMEQDNFLGGVQALLDALKSADLLGDRGNLLGRLRGWFFENDPEFIELHTGQIVTGEKAWIEISLFGEMEK